MTGYALGLFVVAALGGLAMAVKIFRGQLAPWALSLLHAGLGAAGLVLLLVAVVGGNAETRVTAALIVLVVAALGGFYLAAQHLRKTIPPRGVVVVHAAVAAIGVVTLLTTFL